MGIAAEPEVSTLGPSVTSEFADAIPLDDLAKRPSVRKVAAPKEVKPEPPVLSREVFASTTHQIDVTISALLKIEPEDSDVLASITDSLYPLANYYAQKEATVTTLWLVAGLSFLSYASLKAQKLRYMKESEDVTEIDDS